MIRRRFGAVAITMALLAAGCGDGSGDAAALEWSVAPTERTNDSLPDDRILSGELRNAGEETIELEADDFAVVDADGERLPTATAFLTGFVRSNAPYNRAPLEIPEADLERLGRIITLAPGETAAVTISWREPPGAEQAVTVDSGQGSLGLP